MSVMTRRVASIPARSSSGTWEYIISLLAPSGSSAYDQLRSATNTASMLIAEEYASDKPIVVRPVSGPRVRVYTVHGDAAIETLEHESLLPQQPLANEAGWTLSLPCDKAELDSFKSLVAKYPNIVVRELSEDVDEFDGSEAASSSPRINLEEMRRK